MHKSSLYSGHESVHQNTNVCHILGCCSWPASFSVDAVVCKAKMMKKTALAPSAELNPQISIYFCQHPALLNEDEEWVEACGHKTELWSVGCTLCVAFTGQLPFAATKTGNMSMEYQQAM